MRKLALLVTVALTAVVRPAPIAPPIAAPNPNTSPAGSLRDGVLTISLEAKLAMWHPDGDSLPGIEVEAFAEVGGPPQVPGPFVRVPVGTEIRVAVRNALERDTLFLSLRVAAAADSVEVAPGGRGELRVSAVRPGNYLYRAGTSSRLGRPLAGLLAGAVVVDSVGAATASRDRVFVIQGVADSTFPGMPLPLPERSVWAINGRSWPHTERFMVTVGDTLHWRWINASLDQHPMHLHGFYFQVDDFGGPPAAVAAQGPLGRRVVTERLAQFTSMTMRWAPERAGNWLFHCHFQEHLVPHGPLNAVRQDGSVQRIGPWPERDRERHDRAMHDNHALTGMAGLVLGIEARPRRGEAIATPGPGRRRLRLVAVRDSQFPDPAPSLRFVLEDPRQPGQRLEAGPGISPPIELVRGEPVSIMVVNHMREPTAVHWHGIELESFFDGVAGFGGSGGRLAPIIAPRDSFEARFTPPRAGTFIYHSHVDEVRQHRAGLVGALIVRDRSAPGDATEERTFVIKSRRAAPSGAEINGKVDPDTLVLRAGQRYRLRFVAIHRGFPAATVAITSRPDSVLMLPNDTMVVTWRPLAKDGADLPDVQRSPRPARQPMAMGETYDYELTPEGPSTLRIEVRANQRLVVRVPVRVEGTPTGRDSARFELMDARMWSGRSPAR